MRERGVDSNADDEHDKEENGDVSSNREGDLFGGTSSD